MRRELVGFGSAVFHLSDEEFERAFRLSRASFYDLLSRMQKKLLRDAKQAACSSGGVLLPSVRLGVTLRLLSGGSYIDQMVSFHIAKSTVYEVFHDTLRTIVSELRMPGLPLNDAESLRNLADRFSLFRSALCPLYGCIGALDGLP